MRHARLEESQAGIKICGRNKSNLRYADNTTLMAEIEKELKSFLISVEEESERASLRLNIKKTKTMGVHQADPKAVSHLGLKFSEDFLTDFRLGEQERLVRGQEMQRGFPGGSVVKNPPGNAGDQGSIPRSGRSPRGRNANALQYSCLENSMDRRAW